jgi:hypothetical protein
MSQNIVTGIPDVDEKVGGRGAYVVALWPVLIGTILVVGGILLDLSPKEFTVLGFRFAEIDLFSLIFKELGVAFLIAFVISIVIEKKAREERDRLFRTQMHRVQKNVLEAVYARKIPDDYFKYIETHLFQQTFYRTNLFVNYVLALRDGGSAQVTCTTSYDVTNNSYDKAPCTVRSNLEKPFRPDLFDEVKLKRLYVKAVGADNPLLDLKEGDVAEALKKKIVERVVTGEQIRYGYPFELKPGETYTVSIENSWPAKGDAYDFWRAAAPVDGIRYQVFASAEDFDVRVVPIHPVAPRRIAGGPGDDLQGWEISSPLTPYQGFLVMWSAKKTALAAPA